MTNLNKADEIMMGNTPNPIKVDGEEAPIVPEATEGEEPTIVDEGEGAEPVEGEGVDPQLEVVKDDEGSNAVDPNATSVDDEEDLIFEDWDLEDDDSESVVETTPAVDFTAYQQELGDTVDSQDSVISSIKSIKDENKRLKAELQTAAESVVNQEDTVDYESIPPQNYFIEAAKTLFTDDKGTVDTQALNDYVEDLDPNMMAMQGNVIKSQYVQNAKMQAEQNRALAEAKREKADSQLKAAIKEFDSFNGFKVKDNHKDELYNDISTGKAIKDLFYNESGEYDMSKVVKAVYFYKKGEQMEKFRAQRAKNDALRGILDDSTNADLSASGRIAPTADLNDKPDPFAVFAKQHGMPGFEKE